MRRLGELLLSEAPFSEIMMGNHEQPLDVRLGHAPQVVRDRLAEACRIRHVREIRVFWADLPDVRMQNIALLAAIHAHGVIPGVDTDHFEKAIRDLMTGKLLESNMRLFRQASARLGR